MYKYFDLFVDRKRAIVLVAHNRNQARRERDSRGYKSGARALERDCSSASLPGLIFNMELIPS